MKMIYEDLIQPFTQNQLQLFGTIAKRAKDWGLSVDEFYKLYLQEQEEKKKQLIGEQESFPLKPQRGLPVEHGVCPECRAALFMVPVNTGPGDQVGGDYKWMLCCSNEINCIYTELVVEKGR